MRNFHQEGSCLKKDQSISQLPIRFLREKISLREKNPAHFKIFDTLLDSLESINNGPGIEKVKTIKIGYRSRSGMDKWKTLLLPGKLQGRTSYRKGDDPELIYRKGSIKEIQGIIFKVRSLEQARVFLVKDGLAGKMTKHSIELDPSKAFGLCISFEE